MKAAILRDFKKPLSIEELERPSPEADEVLIQVEACGACHSDLHVADRGLAAAGGNREATADSRPRNCGSRSGERSGSARFCKSAIALACPGFTGAAATANFAAKATRTCALARR